jgi:hypothetical protein
MRFFTLAVPITLSLITGANAWAQAANGVWVANNQWYIIGGSMLSQARNLVLMYSELNYL